MALVTASAIPAQAAVTSVSGSLSCPAGQVVWVHVVTTYSAPVTFYSGTALRTTDRGGYDHVFNYGTRTVNWKVVSSDIQTATDYCGSNVTRPSE
ncbi:hypothetical protein GCM10017710_04370 [Arthrobacter ramosus]